MTPDEAAELQNSIARAIGAVDTEDSDESSLQIRQTDLLRCCHCLSALAAAVRDPVIWAAVANARQVVVLAERPIASLAVRR